MSDTLATVVVVVSAIASVMGVTAAVLGIRDKNRIAEKKRAERANSNS